MEEFITGESEPNCGRFGIPGERYRMSEKCCSGVQCISDLVKLPEHHARRSPGLLRVQLLNLPKTEFLAVYSI